MSFETIRYKGHKMQRDGYNGTLHTIVMKKSNADQLDMRFKCNKEFVEMNKKFTKQRMFTSSHKGKHSFEYSKEEI